MKLKVAAAALLVAAAAPALAHADACSGLRAMAAPHVTIVNAAETPAGTTLTIAPNAPPFRIPLAFCRVQGVSQPTPDSQIGFEIWLPTGAGWNGKYLQVGNGGFAGGIDYGSLALGVSRGYAVASTDDGHRGSGIDASFALHHPEKVKDFGYRALRETTLAARAAISQYERRAPAKAYFYGCSDGGREALMEVQRYPQDFDGVVAGAPASAWTRLLGGGGLMVKTLLEPGRYLPPQKLDLLQAASLRACGGADGYVAAPGQCRFDPAVMACKGAATASCLTPGELATVRMIYSGVKGQDGYAYPGLMPGAEGAWRDVVGSDASKPGESPAAAYAYGYFANMVREDPRFEVKRLTQADIDLGRSKLAGVLDSDNPDISAFKARGGKLIQYHGWNDPLIPPGYSTRYFDSVRRKVGDPSSFYRLYMIPGMLHCGGGDGPSGVDWLALLEAWVEHGQAPGAVVASGGAGRSQTLRPFN